MNDEIIVRIQAVIDHYGLTVSAFADEIGVQRSSISHLLNGRNKPSLDFVMKLVNTYPDVNLYWLLKGEGGFPDDNEKVGNTNSVEKKIEKELKVDDITSPEKTKMETGEPVKIVMFYPNGTFKSFNLKND